MMTVLEAFCAGLFLAYVVGRMVKRIDRERPKLCLSQRDKQLWDPKLARSRSSPWACLRAAVERARSVAGGRHTPTAVLWRNKIKVFVPPVRDYVRIESEVIYCPVSGELIVGADDRITPSAATMFVFESISWT